MYTVCTDGGSRGNPGVAGIGAVIKKGEEVIHEISEYIGTQTNNVAEYTALYRAFEYLSQVARGEKVEVKMDSELVIRQMKGEYKVKNPALKEIYVKSKELEKHFASVVYTHIRREFNSHADALANKAMDSVQ
jgi:ribonuclease HI